MYPLSDYQICLFILDQLESSAQLPYLLFYGGDMFVISDIQNSMDIEAGVSPCSGDDHRAGPVRACCKLVQCGTPGVGIEFETAM